MKRHKRKETQRRLQFFSEFFFALVTVASEIVGSVLDCVLSPPPPLMYFGRNCEDLKRDFVLGQNL